ncbi:MAG: hypothetical protein BWY01_01787 [Synergistetes bacterium ADurb.Bin155]|nr:MAG: hypothetical protein BWY01_01787 [Synergistetes bacterium ADurb.Bin155]
MSGIKDLLNQEEFTEYRKAEIAEGIEFLKGVWSNPETAYVRGALDMLSRIIRVPERIAKTPKTKEFAAACTARDFAEFEAGYLRQHLFAVNEDEKGD